MLIIFFTQNFKEAKIHFFGYKQTNILSLNCTYSAYARFPSVHNSVLEGVQSPVSKHLIISLQPVETIPVPPP